MKRSTHLTDKQLIGYTQLTLSDALRETMNQHLAVCVECRARRSELEALEHHIRHQLALEIKKAQPPSQLTLAQARTRAARRFDILKLWTSATHAFSTGVGLALIAVLAFALVTLFQEVNQPATPSEDANEIDPAITTWLREQALPITSLEPRPNDDFSDLMALKHIVGDARIVSLGESSYGTPEFTLLKNRMIRFLIEEMGFTTIVVDLPWADADYLNQYITRGQGFATAVLDGSTTFGWNSHEALDLIEWLRAHNRNQAISSRINIHGMDKRDPFRAFTNVVRYFVMHEPGNYFVTWENFDCLISGLKTYFSRPLGEQNECRAKLQAVKDRLIAHRDEYVQRGSQSAYDFALRSVDVLLWSETYHRQTDAANAEALHDQSMAEEVQRLIEQIDPASKVIIWAHNDHIANMIEGAVARMGNILRRTYGDDLVSFGFAMNQGSLRAYAVTEHHNALTTFQTSAPAQFSILSAQRGSFEWYAHSSDLPAFMLDLRGLNAAGDWLNQSLNMRSIHDTYLLRDSDLYFVPYDLPRAFDAIVYIDHALPAPPPKSPRLGS